MFLLALGVLLEGVPDFVLLILHALLLMPIDMQWPFQCPVYCHKLWLLSDDSYSKSKNSENLTALNFEMIQIILSLVHPKLYL
jgi:hypothetical protein